MSIAVIGGGIAGLVAAFELVRRGERPLLIEGEQCGGMIRSQHVGGFTLEQGPNVLVERPGMRDLLSELGLREKVRYPSVNPYGQFVWCRGKATLVPQGLKQVISTPLLSLAAKILLPVKLAWPGVLHPKREDLSVLEFFTPLIGERAVRDLLDPVLKGIYGGDVEQLSARTLFPGLWDAATKRSSVIGYMRNRPKAGRPSIMVVEGGIQTISDALLERLRDHMDLVSAQVERIEALTDCRYRIACSDGRSFEVKGCVLTPAGKRLAQIIQGMAPDLAETLQQQQYASLGVAHLAVPRDQPLIKDAFGVLFNAGMPDDLLGVMFNSQIFPHVAPSDKHLLTVIVGGAQARSREFDVDRLQERLPSLLSQLLGIASVEWLAFTPWREAIPQLKVGHYKVVAALDRFEESCPGLVICGVDRGGVGVTERVRLAQESVQRLLSQSIVYKSVA